MTMGEKKAIPHDIKNRKNRISSIAKNTMPIFLPQIREICLRDSGVQLLLIRT